MRINPAKAKGAAADTVEEKEKQNSGWGRRGLTVWGGQASDS